MAIEGRSPRDAADKFCGILNSMLRQTVTKTPLRVRYPLKGAADPLAVIAFLDNRGMAGWDRLPPSTLAGRLRWSIIHECGFEQLGKHRFVLETVKYAYHLRREDESEPFLRWEYVKHPPLGKTWCRHHVQGPIDVVIGGLSFRLEDFHTPTGFVTVEEIVQFCIHDLKVRPIAEEWHDVLSQSYRNFAESLRKRH